MTILNRHTGHTVRFRLNGRNVEGQCEPRMLLSDFLRREAGSLDSNVGCEHGVCGACTVQIDGKAERACLTLAVQVDGRSVDTVASLEDADGKLGDLQAAFRKRHAIQCGYCAPGILMSLDQLIRQEPDADEARVRDVLSGHICRCTGYGGMVSAAMDVLKSRRTKSNGDNSDV